MLVQVYAKLKKTDEKFLSSRGLEQIENFLETAKPVLKKAKKKELTEEWNKDYTGKYPIIPDTRVYFGVDGLEESLKNGNWTPYTDSFLNLCIGNISILGVM